MIPEHRERFDAISAFVAVWPFPVENASIIKASRFFGHDGFKYFNDDFPYIIYYYVADDGDVEIDLVVRAFVA